MSKTIVTQEHLDKWPHLATDGVQVGDEIELPTEESTNENSSGSEDDDADENLVAGEKENVDEGAHLDDDAEDEDLDLDDDDVD